MDLNFLGPVFLGLIPVVFPFLVSGAAILFKRFDAKLPANVQPVVSSLASQAVAAAEQSLKGQAGSAKFAAASTWLSAGLKSAGISLSSDEIKSVIEEAVYYLNQNQAQAPAAPAQTAA